MEAAQYREQLDIVMMPGMQWQCYQRQRSKYDYLIAQARRELPEKPPSGHIDAASEEARDLLMGVMRSLKRSAGYG